MKDGLLRDQAQSQICRAWQSETQKRDGRVSSSGSSLPPAKLLIEGVYCGFAGIRNASTSSA